MRMLSNVPDDWDCYWHKCSICGSKYHASEPGCGCRDDMTECRSCGEWTDNDDLDDYNECEGCIDDRACVECDSTGSTSPETLVLVQPTNEWWCQPCIDKDEESCLPLPL